ncbi:hypothetical protein [Armatimonas sp.]|uniref:hypothetical protein n=1 Tax=Armatimonas sp. TaxID=1872638 RepID=UPI0037519812
MMPRNDVEKFNKLIEDYNNNINRRNAFVEIYEKDRGQYNDHIQRVNSYIKRQNALGEEIGPTYYVIVGGKSKRR